MPIHFLSGKPGSGKSLYGVHLLIKEITQGNRNVSTNLPLHPGRLNEYLQQKFPNSDFRLVQRLTILTEDQAREFWKHRGEENGKLGVMFLLDELHLFFNARDWMNTGRDCLHYLSQHRKLGDIVVAITQAVSNVDKQFRSVAEDFTVMRNEYTASYGPFRGRGRFVRKTYNQEPNGTKNEPFETAAFSIDVKGVASCYDTAQGIGIHGSAADKGRRANGWSIWWTVPLGLGVASLCGFIPFALGKGAGKIMGEPAVAVTDNLDKVASAGPAIAKIPSGEFGQVHQANGSSVSTVWVTGWVIRGKQINVSLSDGRTITEQSGMAKVERNRIIMSDGTVYWRGSTPSPQRERPAFAKETTSGRGLLGEPASPQGAPATPTVFPSIASESGSGSGWFKGADGVTRYKEDRSSASGFSLPTFGGRSR